MQMVLAVITVRYFPEIILGFFFWLKIIFFLKLRPPEHACRQSISDCDLTEYCTGETGQCPEDIFKKNGSPCGKENSNTPNCKSIQIHC